MAARFGLLGEKLGHSYSPQIHALLGDYEYRLYEVEKEGLGKFLTSTKLSGMNVTIPYKKAVMEYCAYISPAAKRMGAVNTLVRREDGWHGDNTDYYGFKALVKKSGIAVKGKKALVLGSGGASGTAVQALKDMGAGSVTVISRSGENNYGNIAIHKDADVLVNATPVGMYPGNGKSALELNVFTNLSGVIDVIYNPARTKLMLDAEEMGIAAAGGLYMLVAQAKRASELFTGKDLPESCMEEITKKLSTGMKNIVLVGMPGCGKSTIGRFIAEATGRKLIETDDEIVKAAGKSIPEIFKEGGEEGFRKLETLAIEKAGKESGCIISTGGGCITRKENYALLHQNGIIIWIKRGIDKLSKKERPLSQANPLEKLYSERKDKYAFFADYEVDNEGRFKDAADKILEMLQI